MCVSSEFMSKEINNFKLLAKKPNKQKNNTRNVSHLPSVTYWTNFVSLGFRKRLDA